MADDEFESVMADLEIDDLEDDSERKKSTVGVDQMGGGRHARAHGAKDEGPGPGGKKKKGGSRGGMAPPSMAPPGMAPPSMAPPSGPPPGAEDKNDGGGGGGLETPWDKDEKGGGGAKLGIESSSASRARVLQQQRELAVKRRQNSLAGGGVMRVNEGAPGGGPGGPPGGGHVTSAPQQFSAPRQFNDDPYRSFGSRGPPGGDGYDDRRGAPGDYGQGPGAYHVPPRDDYGGRGGGGGYDDRDRGGYDDRRGGYDDRGGGYDDRRGGGGYDDDRRGGGGYDDRRGGGGYDDRRGGYDDRRGGGGYDDDRRGGGYDDRRGGGGYDDEGVQRVGGYGGPGNDRGARPDYRGYDDGDRRGPGGPGGGGYDDRRGAPDDRRGAPGEREAMPVAEGKELEPLDVTELIKENMRAFLMSPCPAAADVVQCSIKRDRSGMNKLHPQYTVYLKQGELFLMTGKKRPNNKTSNYLVSMGEGDTKRSSKNYLGKLRANFVGTEFQVFDAGWNPNDVADNDNDDQVRQELGVVLYASNVLGSRGPRKMQCGLPMVRGGQIELWKARDKDETMLEKIKQKDVGKLLYLINKPPNWNDTVGAYVLNFNGRVTMASVKNFQLVQPDHLDEILLQFGRVGKDEFTMDFRAPLSPFQAFSICLSSFDSKIACD